MDFLQNWRTRINSGIQQLANRLNQRGQSDAAYFVYSYLAAATLQPLAISAYEAVASGQSLPWAITVGLINTAGGIGSNLIAEQLQRWADGTDDQSEDAIAQWVQEATAANSDLRVALDNMLTHFEVVQEVQANLIPDQQSWFLATLRQETATLGSSLNVIVAELVQVAKANKETARNTKSAAESLETIQDDVRRIADATITSNPLDNAITHYLHQLLREFNQLTDLVALSLDTDEVNSITLDQVYIALNSTDFIDVESDETKTPRPRNPFGEQQDKQPLPMVTAASEAKRLVILGDPGSGKSVFVRHLATQLANAWLKGEDPLVGWQPFVPLLITIRDLGARLAQLNLNGLPPARQVSMLRQAVKAQWHEELTHLGANNLNEQMEQLLASGHVLLIFDGLDEISSRLRPLVYRAVRAVESQATISHIIVTCRIRSYPVHTNRPLLPGFTVRTIAPFTPAQISAFIAAWYEAVNISGNRQQRIQNLQQAATQPHLIKLAENPMLLTTMALIHQSRAELPRQRVRLYAEAVDVLLLRWQKVRGLAIASLLEKAYGAEMTQQLEAVLEDKQRVRRILERLGYEAHLLLEPDAENADLARKEMIALLEQSAYLGSAGLAELFLDYVDHRAGLLVGRGGDETETRPQQYRFPHRTFLEYLAGCYLVRNRRERKIIAQYLELLKQGNDWYVAAQLGIEEMLHNDARQGDVLDILYRLGRMPKPHSSQAKWRSLVWAGYFAVQLGVSAIEADTIGDGAEFLVAFRQRLVAAMQDSPLPIRERAEAGRFLSELGDPRKGVSVKVIDGHTIPDIAWGNWLLAGEYSIGDDHGEYDDEVIRPTTLTHDVRLASYPITYAQFGCFVAAEDAQHKEWWQGIPDDKRQFSEQAFKFNTHPREMVSWYQAIAFCRWLSDKLNQTVDLPLENEWEVAARYPHNKRYPWGSDQFDSLKANTGEGDSIGQTTAVGLYPSGKNETLNLYDMSGNIWEWCRNKYNDLTAINIDPSGDHRTLRGGSWYDHVIFARAAARTDSHPNFCFNSLGFRVCVRRPPSQDL
ncbi:MAG: NACHT domain-containing protein [Candidatus Promineifilaceae bacterium]